MVQFLAVSSSLKQVPSHKPIAFSFFIHSGIAESEHGFDDSIMGNMPRLLGYGLRLNGYPKLTTLCFTPGFDFSEPGVCFGTLSQVLALNKSTLSFGKYKSSQVRLEAHQP